MFAKNIFNSLKLLSKSASQRLLLFKFEQKKNLNLILNFRRRGRRRHRRHPTKASQTKPRRIRRHDIERIERQQRRRGLFGTQKRAQARRKTRLQRDSRPRPTSRLRHRSTTSATHHQTANRVGHIEPLVRR